jgi:hypothetical protein
MNLAGVFAYVRDETWMEAEMFASGAKPPI